MSKERIVAVNHYGTYILCLLFNLTQHLKNTALKAQDETTIWTYMHIF